MNQVLPIATRESMRFETERQLIGTLCAMHSAAAVKAAAAIVDERHFSEPIFARMFHLMKQATAADLDGPALAMGLLQKLRPDEAVLSQTKLTPALLVAHCVAYAMPGIALEATARMVRYDALNVELEVATEAGALDEVQRLGAEMEALERAQFSPPTAFESLGTLTERVLTELNVAYQSEGKAKDFAHCAPTSLARLLGGWRRGRFYVIAGRPGMGKTTLALSSLVRTAIAGHGVLLFSQEMSADEVTEIMLCDLAWSWNRRIEYKDISATAVMKDGFAEKYSEVMQVAPTLRSVPFLVGDRGGLTIADIRSQALQYRQKLAAAGKRLDVVCIDHLGLIKSTGNYRGNKVAETEEVSAALKQLAKELDCAVVALCQLSRATEGRDDKRPTLSDLRWSGGIEQDADVVLMVYREEYYLKKEETEPDKESKRLARLNECQRTMQVFVEKHRGGPTGEVKLFCDIGCGVVRALGEEKWS